jgi:hypothetical protein
VLTGVYGGEAKKRRRREMTEVDIKLDGSDMIPISPNCSGT